MARWLVVLLLTVLVGVGFVGRPLAGPCIADDCDAGAPGDDDHDADDGDGDDCPPFCDSCLRLAVDTTPRVAIATVTLRTEDVVSTTLRVPPLAPPGSGLFRPPRA